MSKDTQKALEIVINCQQVMISYLLTHLCVNSSPDVSLHVKKTLLEAGIDKSTLEVPMDQSEIEKIEYVMRSHMRRILSRIERDEMKHRSKYDLPALLPLRDLEEE
ncbi:hypothetical protein [Stappia sp. TSB10P1A]|uniref:hypothetical protein n=1 Tax=Stappia sp. TSB10P1A TaxID=2003585 RepID=UPI0016438841|nr:hypothetical protein [Stappia sp. TSB10P1A]